MTIRERILIAIVAAWALAGAEAVLSGQEPATPALEEESVPEESRAPERPPEPLPPPPPVTEGDLPPPPAGEAPASVESQDSTPPAAPASSGEAPVAVEAPGGAATETQPVPPAAGDPGPAADALPETVPPTPGPAPPTVPEPLPAPVAVPESVPGPAPVAVSESVPAPAPLAVPESVPAPAPVAVPEPAPENAPGEGAVSTGIKNVWNLLSGQESEGSSPGDPLEKGSTEETQRKVNELVRLANTSIEKGRVAEAIRNVNELITLKPYEADYHFALGLCYRREKKHKEALKKYQDVLDLGGPKALVALLKAEAHAAEGTKEKVFEFLKEAAVGGRNIVNDVNNLPLLTPYQSDTEFIKLALQLEKFDVSAGKVHDPFTNPFPRPDVKGPGEGEEAQGIVSLAPEEQEKLLHDAKKTYERVVFYIKLEDESKAMKAYTSLRDFMKKKDLLTIPKIVNEFRVLMARLEEVEVQIEHIRLKYYYNQAQTKLALIKEAFTDGEYPKVEVIHNEVVSLTKEMELTNSRYKPVAEQVLALSSRWLTRAQIRQEFQSRKPNIQGIIISEDSKMALLNDKVIKQGESVEDFRLVKVESNKVTFRYKGEEIPLVFRRY